MTNAGELIAAAMAEIRGQAAMDLSGIGPAECEAIVIDTQPPFAAVNALLDQWSEVAAQSAIGYSLVKGTGYWNEVVKNELVKDLRT